MSNATVPSYLQPYVLDMAALNGQTVCQGHADVCAILGHGKNLRNGVEQGTCPRCGVVTATPRSQRVTAWVNTNTGSVYVYEDFNMALAFSPVRGVAPRHHKTYPIFREVDGYLTYDGEYRHVIKVAADILGDAGYIVVSDWVDSYVAHASHVKVARLDLAEPFMVDCPRGCGYVGRYDYDRGWKTHFDYECPIDSED